MTHADTFSATFPKEQANIAADANLSAQQTAFKNHLDTWNGSGLLSDHAEAYFRAHQQLGPPLPLGTNEHLGRAHRRRDFVKLLMSEIGLSEYETEELIRDWAALSEAEQITEIRKVIGHLPMSPYLVWAFRNPSAATRPLSSLDLDDLPCRLGLEYSAGELFVFWEFALPTGVIPHTPTAFDAGMRYLPRWKPGGNTVPNSECASKYAVGLPEVVHSPVRFEALSSSIHRNK